MTARPKDDGFTLVEVLVSLAIFSLAIVGLNRAATLAVSGTSSLQMKTYAGFAADNAVVLSRLEPLSVGTERAEVASGGIEFDVSVETRRTEQPGFYEMIVQARRADQDRVLIERRAFRYEAPSETARSSSDGDEP